MQRCGAPEDREQVERRDVGFRDQFDHGMKMQLLRGDSTSQRLKTESPNSYAVCFGVPKPIPSIATASTTCSQVSAGLLDIIPNNIPFGFMKPSTATIA